MVPVREDACGGMPQLPSSDTSLRAVAMAQVVAAVGGTAIAMEHCARRVVVGAWRNGGVNGVAPGLRSISSHCRYLHLSRWPSVSETIKDSRIYSDPTVPFNLSAMQCGAGIHCARLCRRVLADSTRLVCN